MRRLLTIGWATVLALAFAATPARAEPPVHDSFVAKNVAVTVAPPPECPGPGSTIDIIFNEQFHLIFTNATFHVTDTLTGSWVSRRRRRCDARQRSFCDAHLEARTRNSDARGHHLLNATGTTVGGDQVRSTCCGI